MKTQETWINRDVIALAFNRFLSDLGHESGTSILPAFLALLGAPPVALGAIEAVSDGLSSFTKLGAGWLGDRVAQRRPWAALGYVLTGITTGIYGLATAWPGVLVARAVGWAGRGLRSPLHDAMLTDAVPAEARGRAFGLDEAADTAGAVAGPLMTLAILAALSGARSTLDSYRFVFWLAAIPGVLSAVFLLFVRERHQNHNNGLTLRGSLNALPGPFRRYLVGVGIFGAGDFSHTLLILRATQLLSATQPDLAAGISIQLYTLHNVFYAAGSYPVGALADRIGKRGLLVGAYLLAALMNVLLIVATPSVVLLALIFAIGGTVYATQQSLERAVAADLVPGDLRSTGFGALAAVNGVGDFVSSLVVGALWTIVSPAAGFAFSLVLSIAGAGAIRWALRSE
jgi:MFS family permease